jgi:hypothetical protein
MIEYEDAVNLVTKETGFKSDKFPETCPWSITYILMEGWLPV